MKRKDMYTEEEIQFLKEHGKDGKKQLMEAYKKTFPDGKRTVNGLCDKRSHLGFAKKSKAVRGYPLYSEHEKKGMIQIKVAQPSVWMQKQKWVWLEYNPELYNTVKPTDVFIFIDGDRTNFHPSNIMKMSRAELGVMNRNNPLVKGERELNLVKIARTKLTIATLDAGEKIGDVVRYQYFRRSKEKARLDRRKYYNEHYRGNPNFYRHMSELSRNRRLNWTPEQKEKVRKYQREWARKKNEKNNNSQKN